MKFNKNKVISSMTMLAAGIVTSVSVNAAVFGNEDGQPLHWATANNEGSAKVLANLAKATSSNANEYFVILEDAPLATYDGANSNYAATNVFASKGSNASEGGKLNTKSMASKRYRGYLAAKQTEAKLHAELRLKRQVNVKRDYSIVLNGFVTELSPSEAKLLLQLDGIKAVEQVGIDQLDTDSGPAYSGADKVWNGSADNQIPGHKGEGVIVAVIDSGIASYLEPVEDIYDTENLPPFHPSFADVGADGYNHTNPLGEGVYLGDCADRTVGGKFIPAQENWCNDKLIGVVGVGVFGKDIINETMDDARTETGQDANGHGTHTASTAAGNVVRNIRTEAERDGLLEQVYEETFTYEQISGVAPHANIISYQVCNSYGSCNQSYTITAIEHAVEAGADVANYSIGGPVKSPWYQVTSLAFLAAREAGISIATSAGNTGYNGSYTIGTPANAPWVTGVAANTHNRAFNDKVATLSGGAEDFDIDHFVGSGATVGLAATEVVFAEDVEHTGEGSHSHTHTHSSDDEDDFYHESYDEHTYTTDEYNSPIAYEHTHVHDNMNAVDVYAIAGACGLDSMPTERVKDKVVICNRGGQSTEGFLSRMSKSYAVEQLGAAGMILINTSDTRFDTTMDDFHVLPAVHLKRKAGKKLLEWLEQGEGHKVAISNSKLVADDTFAGIMGNFSSRGPDPYSHDYLVPDLSSAGVKILAAGLGEGMGDKNRPEQLKSDKDFVYMTGTSMSSPHVAGMFALIKGAHPNWSAAETQSALMLTSSTGLKNYGAFEDGEQTFEPANLHQTGAGMARVDLAIASGLIMHETENGYLTADPFGDIPGMIIDDPDGGPQEEVDPGDLRDATREPIVDWHGEPSKINIASLSKGDCELECSWTRTFKATKAASWELSYSYLSEGFELSSNRDGESIDVVVGEEFSVTFYATLTGQLDDVWVNGRVHMSATDSTIPEVSLPVAVEFDAGDTPESIEINAHRNRGSVSVEDIVTVGTDELTITASSLTKADIFDGNVQRAKNPTQIYQDVRLPGKPGLVAIPLNIPWGSSRLVVEVLETSSPDLDIYVGEDFNSDGVIQQKELDAVYFWSNGAGSNEMLDYPTPKNGQYWVMVHNFGDHYNNSQHEGFDPSALVLDSFKLSVSVVESDDDSLSVKAPKSVARGAEVPTTLNWDKDMVKDERFYGLLNVATSKQQLNNVGIVNITLNRGEDDVKLSLLSNDADTERAGFDITIAENNSGQDRHYKMSIDLVTGSIVESLTQQSQVSGQAAQSAGDNIDFSQEGDTLTWEYLHVNGAPAQTVSLIIHYAEVEGLTNVTPAVYSVLNEQDEGEYSHMTTKVMVQGRPVFDLSATEQYVDPGTIVTITASLIDAVIDNPMLSYNWEQVEGPKAELSVNDNVLSFTVPNNADGKRFLFEMTGHNGERSAVAQTMAISVTGEDVGESGSFGWFFMLLAMLSVCTRNCTSQSTRKCSNN
ncbi:S8 family serine peptidase [Thalassotalea psychrophila]|uniref:S8 family serine peptidase n=1 Tax=Thalassotalea psychrophila TaxID=3065647 RepID=A0ABY9TYE8_9GAMM|nr:S8 family serine peptidase [Colwelliaceae bacterium SQ149]